MTSDEFKKEIATNPKNVYCLVSTDSRMIDLYIKRFKESIGADRLYFGDIKPIGKLFKTKTLNILYMPKLKEDVFARQEYIFIHTDSIDKRSSAYKKYKNQIIELNNDFVPYVMKHSNLTKEQAIQFVNGCHNDLGRIDNTLSIYNISNTSYNEFVEYIGDIYLWVDNFIKKEKLPVIVDSPISIMALLATNCTNLLKVKTNKTEGINPYAIKYIKPNAKYRTVEELANIISDCFYLDSSIKKGLINVDYAIDYLIVKYHRKEIV